MANGLHELFESSSTKWRTTSSSSSAKELFIKRILLDRLK